MLIADDDALLRARLRTTLAQAGLDIMGEARTGRDALRLALRHRPDVVLVDLTLPELDGIGVTRRLRGVDRDTAVIVMASAPDDEAAVAALRAGAAGFLPKDLEPSALPRAVRAAVDGEAVVSRRLAAVLVRRLRDTTEGEVGLRPVRSALTPREWEVLDLLCVGESTDDIARTLFLARETVRTHVKHILRKTGATCREEAVARSRELRRPTVVGSDASSNW